LTKHKHGRFTDYLVYRRALEKMKGSLASLSTLNTKPDMFFTIPALKGRASLVGWPPLGARVPLAKRNH